MKQGETAMNDLALSIGKLAESIRKAKEESEKAGLAFVKFAKAYKKYNSKYSRFKRCFYNKLNWFITNLWISRKSKNKGGWNEFRK
jgi:hypothetical protein